MAQPIPINGISANPVFSNVGSSSCRLFRNNQIFSIDRSPLGKFTMRKFNEFGFGTACPVHSACIVERDIEMNRR